MEVKEIVRILLIEDDILFASTVAEYLTDNGIEVQTIRTVEDALSTDLNAFRGAIVDVMLPNNPSSSGIPNDEARGGYMTGVALTRRLKKQQPNLPIVLLSSEIAGGEARAWAKENGHLFVSKLENRSCLLTALHKLGLTVSVERPRSFIVHGHDEELLLEMKDYLQNVLHWPRPVVLRDQPSCGKTIIEKFEQTAGLVDWVFVLLSPDDKAFLKASNDELRRARQNVIFELGFFYGLLGRYEGRVIALRKGDVEMPSDIHGVVWIDVTNGVRAAGEDLRMELGV
ncbi:MAG: nucleotide-binding protein [Desulfosalsimonadaceae bacterium]|nr:nucleotide-binding protein [Desulfosalsimonadaceae bacterium]